MDAHELRRLLDAVQRGEIAPEEAERLLRWRAPFEEAGGFAKVDLHRRLRCGFPEVVFGQGKTADQIVAILQTLERHGEGGLVTRVGPEIAAALQQAFPE